MNIKELQKNWDNFGKIDPLWAIISWSDKKGNKWRIEEFFDTGIREINEIIKYVELLDLNIPRRKALDFGCGVGRLTQALANYFDKVYGVDVAPSMIKLANKYNRHGDKCKYYLNEMDNLRLFPNSSFDFIYTNITFQHMEPRYSKNYIKEFLRILVPHGLCIFQLPSKPTPYCEKSNKDLKQLIKLVAPKILLILYYKFLNLRAKILNLPRMEMFGIKQKEVIKLLKNNKAKIVDIIQNKASGPNWVSFRYCVTKE